MYGVVVTITPAAPVASCGGGSSRVNSSATCLCFGNVLEVFSLPGPTQTGPKSCAGLVYLVYISSQRVLVCLGCATIGRSREASWLWGAERVYLHFIEDVCGGTTV